MKPRFLAILTITALLGLVIAASTAFPTSAGSTVHPYKYAGTWTGSFTGSKHQFGKTVTVTGNMSVTIKKDGSFSGLLSLDATTPSGTEKFSANLSGNVPGSKLNLQGSLILESGPTAQAFYSTSLNFTPSGTAGTISLSGFTLPIPTLMTVNVSLSKS